VVSQGGTDTQRVTPGSSDETRQQSTVDEDDVSTDEEVVPTDITYPSSKCRPEVSCIVCVCPETHFYQ
jgi:hypothetical protein